VAPLVLHVLPVDLSRGAQTYARQLRAALDGPDTRHRTLALFQSRGGALDPDEVIDVAPGLARRAGLDPRVLLRLRRVVAEQCPAVVVAHGGEPLKYAALVGIPASRLVYYKIGAGNVRLTGPRRWFHRRLLRRAGTIAAVSAAAADEARALGAADDRLRVIPNGRDPAAYGPPPTPDAACRLVFVGHLDPPKRPELFLALARALRASGADDTAAIAGDGPLLASLRTRADDSGVALLGRVEEIPALLARSDVLVLTSAAEGMPGVLIEAGLASLPVVTTDVAGASDVVDDGVTGFVVGVDDFDALVHATRTLVDDAGRRRRMGDAARRRCTARFSLDASVRQWRALLDELIAEPCTSST
jgi:glycosyltransferase involved in cell wall biosynthesis